MTIRCGCWPIGDSHVSLPVVGKARIAFFCCCCALQAQEYALFLSVWTWAWLCYEVFYVKCTFLLLFLTLSPLCLERMRSGYSSSKSEADETLHIKQEEKQKGKMWKNRRKREKAKTFSRKVVKYFLTLKMVWGKWQNAFGFWASRLAGYLGLQPIPNVTATQR